MPSYPRQGGSSSNKLVMTSSLKPTSKETFIFLAFLIRFWIKIGSDVKLLDTPQVSGVSTSSHF